MASGDTVLTKKNDTPHEDAEQMLFVQWFKRTYYPEVWIHSIPNEAKRSLAQRAKMKAMGLSGGVLDLHVPKWNLWIEMKRQKGGVLRKEQKDWIEHLEGFDTVIVAYGWEDAKRQVLEFLENREKVG